MVYLQKQYGQFSRMKRGEADEKAWSWRELPLSLPYRGAVRLANWPRAAGYNASGGSGDLPAS
jgi:hypothetical protein